MKIKLMRRYGFFKFRRFVVYGWLMAYQRDGTFQLGASVNLSKSYEFDFRSKKTINTLTLSVALSPLIGFNITYYGTSRYE